MRKLNSRKNGGAHGSDHPEADLNIILSEIKLGQGTPTRPLTALPQGVVLDTHAGKDGLVELKALEF